MYARKEETQTRGDGMARTGEMRRVVQHARVRGAERTQERCVSKAVDPVESVVWSCAFRW